MVIWLIGLAGAGKTSIGREVAASLKARDLATVFLDGDHFRRILDDDVGHSLAERKKNGWRICRFCDFLDQQNINVVCSILSLFPEQRTWNRGAYSKYFEVFIDVPMTVLEERDQKGLYSGARAGQIKNVAGIDLEFVPPQEPDYVVFNGEFRTDFRSVADEILTAMDAKFGTSQ